MKVNYHDLFSTILLTDNRPIVDHSQPQRPRSFWSSPGIATSGLHSGQTTGNARDLSNSGPSGHFPVSSHKIFTVNLRHSSHLGTKSNHSAPTNVLLPSFTAQAIGSFIWKSDPRETDNNSYRDYNTSLHVSLRTRKFDNKIHYCCR